MQFTGDGKFVRIIGGKKGSKPGELQLRHGGHIVNQQGRIIVADSDNKQLSVFSSGTFIKILAAPSPWSCSTSAT